MMRETPPPISDGEIGDGHSMWLRTLRSLLDEGKPLGEITVLAFGQTPHGDLAFGTLTYTKNNRLVFWPVLPKRFAHVIDDQGVTRPFDHVTLEFPSRKMHVTWLENDGTREHHSVSWRMVEFGGTGLSLWIRLAFRWSILKDQDHILERWIKAPTTDVERRKSEIARLAGNINFVKVLLPPGEPEGDYVFASLYVTDNSFSEVAISSEAFIGGGKLDDVIEGWPDGRFAIKPTGLHVGPVAIVAATACPPGRIREPMFLGFPRRRIDPA